MSNELSSSARRLQDVLSARGLACEVVELGDSTRTAAEAAQAIGCRVEQIAKSLVFKTKQSGRPILVIASGINRVNEKSLGLLLGEPIEKGNAAFVRDKTGFVIGGVPPVGHLDQLETLLDEDLMQYSEIWAAAGTPNAVFRLTPPDLKAITGGKVTCVK